MLELKESLALIAEDIAQAPPKVPLQSKMKLCECGCGKYVKNEGSRFCQGHNSRSKDETISGIHRVPVKFHLCECGCGQIINSRNRFVSHHHYTEETRRKMSLSMMGKNNGKSHPQTKESNEKRSKAILKAHADPTKYKSGARIKGYFFSSKNNDNIPYRSSNELEVIQFLELDSQVDWYKYESERISYFFEGKQRTTVPDFLIHFVDGHTEIWEFKMSWALYHPKVRLHIVAKVEGMKKYALQNGVETFRLVTEEDLVSMASMKEAV